jgi:DNA-binding NarL/FixJ family response regulator
MKDPIEYISVWIVDDDVTICSTLKEFIQQSASYMKVTTFQGCEPAFQALRKAQSPPDVVLLDIHMPGMSGIEGISQFKKMSPGSAVIMLTASFMDDEIMQAFSEGAEGYLLKTVQISQIVDSIRAAMRGGVPLDPLVARKILEMNMAKGLQKQEYGLTEIEKNIIRLLVEGSTLRQISDVLSSDFSAVNSHLRSIHSKLGVRTRSALVMKAQKERLV